MINGEFHSLHSGSLEDKEKGFGYFKRYMGSSWRTRIYWDL